VGGWVAGWVAGWRKVFWRWIKGIAMIAFSDKKLGVYHLNALESVTSKVLISNVTKIFN
jgi:hypothetical protein